MIPVCMLFNVKYGTNLELNKQTLDDNGIPFISRKGVDNGVAAKIAKAIRPKTGKEIDTCPGHTLSVALGGSVLSTFYQKNPYYTGRDVACLIPKINMSIPMMIYYKLCIEQYKDNFDYNHQANKYLPYLNIPHPSELPPWVKNCETLDFGNLLDIEIEDDTPKLDFSTWKYYRIDHILNYQKGWCSSVDYKDSQAGQFPVVSSSGSNNGINGSVDYDYGYYQEYKHRPAMNGVITISKNGECWDTFYQHKPFVPSIDIFGGGLKPEFNRKINAYIALFLKVLFEKNKINFGYGRKLREDRFSQTLVLLPSKLATNEPTTIRDKTNSYIPDWDWIEHYMKTLYCSKPLNF